MYWPGMALPVARVTSTRWSFAVTASAVAGSAATVRGDRHQSGAYAYFHGVPVRLVDARSGIATASVPSGGRRERMCTTCQWQELTHVFPVSVLRAPMKVVRTVRRIGRRGQVECLRSRTGGGWASVTSRHSPLLPPRPPGTWVRRLRATIATAPPPTAQRLRPHTAHKSLRRTSAGVPHGLHTACRQSR